MFAAPALLVAVLILPVHVFKQGRWRLCLALAPTCNQGRDALPPSAHTHVPARCRVAGSEDYIKKMRKGLCACKTLLTVKRTAIRQLWLETQEYTQMVKLYEDIENIKKVPEEVDRLMESKHHVHAARQLVRTLNMLELTEPLGRVRALRDLHGGLYLRTEEMHKVLIKELSDHIYLRGDCGLRTVGEIIPIAERFKKPGSLPDEDLSENPAANSEKYMALTVKALSVLNRVEDTVEELQSRLESELTLTIEKALAYAEDHLLPEFTSRDVFMNSQDKVAVAKDQSGPGLLLKLLAYLYERMLRIFMSHAIVLNAIRRSRGGKELLGKRKPGKCYDELSVWKAIQIKIELLLCQYLGVGEDAAVESFQGGSSIARLMIPRDDAASRGNISRTTAAADGQADGQSASVPLFSFARSENAITETSVKKETSLRQETTTSSTATRLSTIDTYTSSNLPAARLLCEQCSLNIAGIFKPTMVFTDEMHLLLSAPGAAEQPPPDPNALALRHFVESYVTYCFLKEVREDVSKSVQMASEQIDKPTDDHNCDAAPRILLKSALEMNEMMGQLCGLLLDLPHFSKEFVALMINALTVFRKACDNNRRRLIRSSVKKPTSLRKGPVVLSAEWIGDKTIYDAVCQDKSWALLHNGRDSPVFQETSGEGSPDDTDSAELRSRSAETTVLLDIVKKKYAIACFGAVCRVRMDVCV